MLEKNERIDIIPGTDLEIIQNTDKFCYGIDAILLSYFARPRKKDLVLDLGTGTAIVALRMQALYGLERVYGLEIQEEMARMAQRSVDHNDLSHTVKILNKDLKELSELFDRDSVDLIVSNPPYMKEGAGILNPHDALSISRHEVHCNIEDIIREASLVLKGEKGRLVLIHRPNRLVDIFYYGRKYRLEPKRMALVHPKKSKPANLVLVELVKYGGQELLMEEPIYVYEEDGSYTEMIHEIYGRKDEGYDKW